jgi:hypothetical protein
LYLLHKRPAHIDWLCEVLLFTNAISPVYDVLGKKAAQNAEQRDEIQHHKTSGAMRRYMSHFEETRRCVDDEGRNEARAGDLYVLAVSSLSYQFILIVSLNNTQMPCYVANECSGTVPTLVSIAIATRHVHAWMSSKSPSPNM